MANNNIDEKLEEAIISKAVKDMLIHDGVKIRAEFDAMSEASMVYPDEKHSCEFEAEINAAYRNNKIKSLFKSMKKPMRYLTVSLAAIIVIFSVSVVSVDAFREQFFNWVMSAADTHLNVNFIEENSKNYNKQFEIDNLLTALPSGYIYESTEINNHIKTATYFKQNYFFQVNRYFSTCTINIDSEETNEVINVSINDSDGIIINKDTVIHLTWSTDNTTYEIFTNDTSLSNDMLVSIAECIK